MNIIDKIYHAIIKINPNAQITIGADKDTTLDNVNIIFHNCNPIPKEQILEILPEVEKEINTINNRIKEYGSWRSQLDEIYHSGLDSWKARLANIKAKYPKE
jgi:hypothetical protein